MALHPCPSCVLSDDNFRANFLWGRKPMLAACAARLQDRSNMIWVDLGGGTGVSGCVPPEALATCRACSQMGSACPLWPGLLLHSTHQG